MISKRFGFETIQKSKWRFVVYVFLGYLIRDLFLYVFVPAMIVWAW